MTLLENKLVDDIEDFPAHFGKWLIRIHDDGITADLLGLFDKIEIALTNPLMERRVPLIEMSLITWPSGDPSQTFLDVHIEKDIEIRLAIAEIMRAHCPEKLFQLSRFLPIHLIGESATVEAIRNHARASLESRYDFVE